MSRVVLTGATGFVGGRVARRLRADGWQVVALVRTPTEALGRLGVEQAEVALTDVDGVARLLDGADAAVHAAAAMGPDLTTAREVNRDGTAAVVAAAGRMGTRRLVHVSTTSVYDRDAAGELIAEDTPLVVEGNPYAVTKAEAETEVQRGVEQGLSAAVLRPPAVLGAGAASTWGTHMPERARDGALPPQHPAASFGWVHIEDLVDAVVAALDGDDAVVTNVVGGHTTWGVYVEAIRSMFPDAPPPPEPDRDPWTGWYATDRLPEVLGVTPVRRFEDGMAEIASWWTGA